MSDKKVPDSFDNIDFGSLTGSGISLEEIQAICFSARSERIPTVGWAKAEGCFRIELGEMIIFVCGSHVTARKIISMIILDMI